MPCPCVPCDLHATPCFVTCVIADGQWSDPVTPVFANAALPSPLPPPAVPGEASGWAKQLLDSFGAVTELQMHAGGHEIGGPDQMRKIAGWMAKVLPPKKE